MKQIYRLDQIIPMNDNKFMFDDSLNWWASIGDYFSDFFDKTGFIYSIIYTVLYTENLFAQSLVHEYGNRIINSVTQSYLVKGKLEKDSQQSIGNLILFHNSIKWLNYIKTFSEIMSEINLYYNEEMEHSISSDEIMETNTQNTINSNNSGTTTKIYGFNSENGVNSDKVDTEINGNININNVNDKKRKLTGDITKHRNVLPTEIMSEVIETIKKYDIIHKFTDDVVNFMCINIIY